MTLVPSSVKGLSHLPVTVISAEGESVFLSSICFVLCHLTVGWSQNFVLQMKNWSCYQTRDLGFGFSRSEPRKECSSLSLLSLCASSIWLQVSVAMSPKQGFSGTWTRTQKTPALPEWGPSAELRESSSNTATNRVSFCPFFESALSRDNYNFKALFRVFF